MPTNMEDALKKAGIRTPTQFERVWRWLKDHQGKTSSEVAVGTKLDSPGLVSTILSQMENRKMIYSALEYRRHTKGAKRNHIKCWYTVVSLKEYVLLPKTKKITVPRTPATVLPSTPEVLKMEVEPKVPTNSLAWPNTDLNILSVEKERRINIESLSVKEAYDLYQQLLRYFGPKPPIV